MASTIAFLSLQFPKCYSKNHTLFAFNTSHFLSSNSLIKLKKQTALSTRQFKNFSSHKFQTTPLIFAAQFNFLKVLQTAWRAGKDGVEAGTNLVPDVIPRPIARICVTVVGAAFAFFALKSFLSTALFALAVMGVIYFGFIAFNKDDGPKGGGGTGSMPAFDIAVMGVIYFGFIALNKDDGPKGGGGTGSVDDSLEEARRIMDKYK